MSLFGVNLLRLVRVITALVLLAWLVSFLGSLATGLISLELLEQGRLWFNSVWRSDIGTLVFLAAFFIHMALDIYAVYRRRVLRMHGWEAVQTFLAFLVPALFVDHYLTTRVLAEYYGVNDLMSYTLLVLWGQDPVQGFLRLMMILLAWVYACIGMHYWLRVKRWYGSVAPLLLIVAVLIPTFGLLGAVQSAREIATLAQDPTWQDALLRKVGSRADLARQEVLVYGNYFRYAWLTVIVLMFFARALRAWLSSKLPFIRITFPGRRVVEVPQGLSVLEASRYGGLPHASLCGGRGACTTCRVRVGIGASKLSKPGWTERRLLRRVAAPSDVRLACQIRPTTDIEVTPLLPATATAADGFKRPVHYKGVQEDVVMLITDLRGFQNLAGGRKASSVVALLNRYFAAMGHAVEQAGGRVDKVIGDGMVALFGVDGNTDEGCRQALTAALDMSRNLYDLNLTLASDLEHPLEVAMSMHVGPAIVGEMGFADSAAVTTVGPLAQLTARLLGVAKDHHVQLVLSDEIAIRANADLSRFPGFNMEPGGGAAPFPIRVVRNAADLAIALTRPHISDRAAGGGPVQVTTVENEAGKKPRGGSIFRRAPVPAE